MSEESDCYLGSIESTFGVITQEHDPSIVTKEGPPVIGFDRRQISERRVRSGVIIISENRGKNWNEVSENTLEENILKNEVTKNLDRLVKVKFDNEKAIFLGQQGVYEISF